MAMSLPVRPIPAPPQRGDWERHKQRIAQLYLEENKPLREVADVMRIEHDFTATPKMYKQRFHQWDFRKNLKAGEVKKFKGLTAAGHETHLPVVHGRKLGSKRLKSLVGKSNQALSKSPEAESSRGTPLPGNIDVPVEFNLPEMALRAVTSYSRSQLDNRFWDLTGSKNDRTETYYWGVGIELAAYKIARKQDLAANFQVLNKCCDEYRNVLRKQDPLLIWTTYNAILQLSQSGDDLAMAFAKLAAGLSLIQCGRSHPLTVLWTSLRRMSMDEVRRAAVPIIDAQFELLRDDQGSDNTFWPSQVVILIKKLHDMQLLTPEATVEKLNNCIQWIQQNPGPDTTRTEEQLNSTRMFITCIYIDGGQYTEADAILSLVESWIENGGQPKDFQRVNCAEIRAELDANVGKLESAEFHYKKALEIAQQLLWQVDPGRIGFSFTVLEKFYLDHGRTAAAQAVRHGYNLHLKSMVGDAEQNGRLVLDTTKEEEDGNMSEDSDLD
ncbi:Clr5 domain-containing protein [Pestalotiopsis sp. NC0098]|nr:Clr5 domain-containing protein [Pestalotiopsis sp. NC0098]